MNVGPAPPSEDEVEVWWGSYSPRAMLPLVVICLTASVALVLLLVFMTNWGLRPSVARWTGYVVLGGLWLALALWCGYRMVGYSYRVTTRRLFYDRGFLHGRVPIVELARVVSVTVQQTAVERWLGIGRVVVMEKDNPAPLVLESVRRPEKMAAKVRVPEITVQSPAGPGRASEKHEPTS
jgi:membrane protein YdbS with pleckstrin-like domain